MSKWLTHLKAFYINKRKTNKTYSYKSAMKDAAKTYKSDGSQSKSKKSRGRTRKMTRSKK